MLDGIKKKTRGLRTTSPSYTSNPSIPIPVITQFTYGHTGPSPLGPNYTRYSYRVNFINHPSYISNNLAIEFKLYAENCETPQTTLVPLSIGNGKPIMGFSTARCIYFDRLNGGPLCLINLLTASLIPKTSACSNYQVNGYNGYVLGSATSPTIAVSQAWSADPSNGTAPCPL